MSRARVVRVQAAGGMPKWDECFRYLVDQKQLRSIQPDEAQDLVNSGQYVLVDVRPPQAHKDSHPAGAISVPMYQPLDWGKPDFGKVVKFIAYSFNGVSPIEPNPDFMDQLKAVTAGGKGIITVCEAGGTLKPTTNFPFGKASRSLQAAYRALAEGVTDKVYHLDRGVYGWYQADLAFGGDKEYAPELGRTPMAAAEPTLQSIRSSVGYQLREDDKKK